MNNYHSTHLFTGSLSCVDIDKFGSIHYDGL